MMKKISLIKKIRLFLSYRKTINKLKFELENNFSARIDNASRIYTVINIPSSLIEEPYNLRKEDIDSLAKTYIKEYTNKLSLYLNQNNLFELYDFYEVKKVEKYSYLLIFGFSLFNSGNFVRNFYIFLTILATLFSILIIFIL